MVPEAGLEPARFLGRGILNPLCLPISPLWHVRLTAGGGVYQVELNQQSKHRYNSELRVYYAAIWRRARRFVLLLSILREKRHGDEACP